MQKISTIAIRSAVSVTATDTGSAVDIRDFQGMAKLVLNSGAMGGTTPTSNIKLQHSDDGSTGWADVSGIAFTQVAAAVSHQELLLNVDQVKRYVRTVNTVAGTTPTQAFGVTLVGKKQSI